MNPYLAIEHNGRLIDKAEKVLNGLVNAGCAIFIKNPDGTTVRLQKGFRLESYEAVLISGLECEHIDF